MKLTTTTFVSLDGVAQGPGSPDEDRTGGFARGGWVIPFFDEELGALVTEIFTHGDAFLFGRRTFALMAAHWPRVTDPADAIAARFNARPKHVVSATLDEVDWAGTEIVRGDLRAAVEALKAQPGDELQVHGSPRLVQGLHDLGLVDEHRLLTFPVVLGGGLRLFAEGVAPRSFAVAEHRELASGVSYRVLRPAGAVAQAAVELVDGAEVMRPVDGQ